MPKLLAEIKKIINKAIISILPKLQLLYMSSAQKNLPYSMCFELLGYPARASRPQPPLST